MNDIQRIGANSRRSRAVVHGGVVYLTGQVCDDKRGDIAQQTQEAFAKIDAALAEVGSNRSKVLSATIWLRSMDDYDGMNAVWDAWIDRNNAPARSCGTVGMADPDFRVEIIVTAAA